MSKISYEKIADGIAIFKPIKSRFWWCRVRVDNHPSLKEIRKSLKTEDKNRAIYEAQRIAFETEIKIRENIDLITSKPSAFRIAQKASERIKSKKPFKPTYPGYIRILENEIIPFLEKSKLKIDELDRFTIEDFFNEYEKKSQTQINMTKTCFKHIFEEALREKLIKEENIPKMPKIEKTEIEETRDYFNEEELATILYRLDDFINSSIKELTKHNRFIFKCYCFWLIGSGARTGKECLIKWNDLEIVKKEGVEILTCKIKNGKTAKKGGRTIVLDKDAFTALELISQYRIDGFDTLETVFPMYPYNTKMFLLTDTKIFENLELLKQKYGDEYVFKRFDNKIIDFSKTFEYYIKFLRKHKYIGVKNHTLYSFRHTYITQKLLNKEGAERWTAEQVATQCGNSLQMIWNFYLHLQALDKVFNFKYYNEMKEKLILH
jgi:hypothetical protein